MIVRGGTLVTPRGLKQTDLVVKDGRIIGIGPHRSDSHEILDATGMHVFPGLIDVHVHFNEPGRTEWEGASTGSQALAAGGGTVYFDMPLNSSPCVVNAAAFDAKYEALSQNSYTDFALWGGIVPGNLGEMEALAKKGVIGFKAFMADSGLAEFPRSDDDTLKKAMKEAARLNLPVALHAEDQSMIDERRQEGSGVTEFLESRPATAEWAAIERACGLARKTGVALHFVHVSTFGGVLAGLQECVKHKLDVSIETCPHYLWFSEDDMKSRGGVLKCAPPLRHENERVKLWSALMENGIDIIGSDHSPAPPEMKQGDDFFKIWGGIAGIQHTLSALMSSGKPERVALLTAHNPAKRFGLTNKGRIAVGCDADFTLVDLNTPHTVTADMLFQRHRLSPYVGETFPCTVRRTVLRGETIYLDGQIVGPPRGKMVTHAEPWSLS